MFLKENIKKARSLFGGFAFAGVAAAALIWGANTATINAQEAVGDATKTSDEAVNAPSGGAANKFLDFYDGGTG
ncbi:MAG: hypothetical protein LH472_07070, partial [Pyrinomonadaceae bacterium]|nr:hypothetical protein [Pyrinomonadaceae bacterium]